MAFGIYMIDSLVARLHS